MNAISNLAISVTKVQISLVLYYIGGKNAVKKLLCNILTFEKVYLLKLLLLLLNPRLCRKGSYKIGLVYPSVYPSVCSAFFSATVHQISLIFCMKINDHKCRKATKPLFWKNYPSPRKLGKRGKFGTKIAFWYMS